MDNSSSENPPDKQGSDSPSEQASPEIDHQSNDGSNDMDPGDGLTNDQVFSISPTSNNSTKTNGEESETREKESSLSSAKKKGNQVVPHDGKEGLDEDPATKDMEDNGESDDQEEGQDVKMTDIGENGSAPYPSVKENAVDKSPMSLDEVASSNGDRASSVIGSQDDEMSTQSDALNEQKSLAFPSPLDQRPSQSDFPSMGDRDPPKKKENEKKQKKAATIRPADDGIFDDAEEDPTLDMKNIKPAERVGGVATLRPELVDIILGSPAKVDLNVKVATPKAKKIVKQKKPKMAKVLKTPRDRRAAEKLLTGKIDLLRVLPKRDCMFLGKTAWIFTLDQLEKLWKDDSPKIQTEKDSLLEELSKSRLLLGEHSSTALMLMDDEPVATADKDSNEEKELSDAKDPTVGTDLDAAKKKFEEWKALSLKWVQENPNAREGSLKTDQFPLDGPLSSLIPKCYQNIFASLELKTLFDLMNLKKTETGILIDMIIMWRKLCHLGDMTHISIAKHLLSVSNRIERAIEEVPGMEPKERKWVGGILNVLTGAAKDYVIDTLEDFSPEKFVDLTTTDLAAGLARWREAKGQPPLKGSGKVAMISAWKTMVRESLEIEAAVGKVITGHDFYKATEPEKSTPEAKKKSPSAQKKEKPKKRVSDKPPPIESVESETIQGNLRSIDFMEKLFPKEKLQLLNDVGIDTAEKLLASEKGVESELVKRIIADREASKAEGAIVQASSCVRLVYDWCAKVRSNLDKNIELVRPISKTSKRKPEQIVEANKKPKRRKKKNPEEVKTVIIRRKEISDPFEILSAAPQEFLKYTNISDANTLLSTRTCDIAENLIKWREMKNLPELKGLGATASVSGWKALVRKTAEEMGQKGLAELEPDGFSKPRAKPKEAKKPHRTSELNFDRTLVKDITSHSFANGLPRIKFAVTKAGGMEYIFELSVRASASPLEKVAPYLTYLGHGTISAKSKDTSSSSTHSSTNTALSVLEPVLDNVPVQEKGSDFRSPFGVTLEECGTIELGRYGIAKFADPDLSFLRKAISQFVLDALEAPDTTNGTGENAAGPSASAPHEIGNDLNSESNEQGATFNESNKCQEERLQETRGKFNVFHQRGLLGESNYFLYLPTTMEAGQAVELSVEPAPAIPFSKESDFDSSQRKWIRENILNRSGKEIKSLLRHVSSELGSVVFAAVDDALSHSGDSRARKAAIARRRLHWVTLKLINAIAKADESTTAQTESVKPLWTPSVVEKMSQHSDWKTDLLPALVAEATEEIIVEVSSPDNCGSFWSTKPMWCSMANRLFSSSLERVALLSIEFGLNPESPADNALVKDIRSMVLVAVTEIQTTALKNVSTTDESDYNDTTMTYRKSQVHFSSVFPSVEQVLGPITQDGYSDAMHLCSEPNIVSDSDNESKNVLAIKVLRDLGNKKHHFSMCTVEQMKALNGQIDQKWYIENQILAVVDAVLTSAISLTVASEGWKLSKVEEAVYTTAMTACVGVKISSDCCHGPKDLLETPKTLIVPKSLVTSSSIPSNCEPHSLPIFLALVWPYLNTRGFKMDVGDSPSQISFLPPEKKRKRSQYQFHQSRAKQRLRLATQTSNLGMGYIPKQTKRLFVKASEENKNSTEDASSVSVSAILEKVKASLQSKFSEDENEGSEIVGDIFMKIESTFNDLAESLLYEEERGKIQVPEGRKASDVLDGSFLMRLLFVMPSMLQQADLSPQQVGTATGVITELIDQISKNYQEYLPKSHQVPQEFYESEPGWTTSIVEQTRHALRPSESTSEDEEMDDLKEILLPSDRGTLTDFIQFVLDQVVATRATAEDAIRKNRRIDVGYIGLTCRHCLGIDGEGKYFFSSLESLCTTSTVMEKHLLKCTKTPQDIKDEMARCRALHSEQRQNFPQGNQASFYNRLWKRLRSSKAKGGLATDLLVNVSTGTSKDRDGVNGGDSSFSDDRGYRTHVDLLDFLRSNSPWKDDKELQNCLRSYYDCLDYGGSIYGTNAMPKNFSAEWLLAQGLKR